MQTRPNSRGKVRVKFMSVEPKIDTSKKIWIAKKIGAVVLLFDGPYCEKWVRHVNVWKLTEHTRIKTRRPTDFDLNRHDFATLLYRRVAMCDTTTARRWSFQ